MSEKFRVAVVTTMDVEAVDAKDAANIAESALWRSLIGSHTATTLDGDLITRWSRNGHDYAVTVTQPPLELNRALRRDRYLRVEVDE